MTRNAGAVTDTNWSGEWRFHDYLGWLPYPIWFAHIESVYDQSTAQWIDTHCPESWRSTQRPQAEGEE